MGVYIKDMEMPTSCNACELVALVDISDGLAYGCRALKEMIYNDRERLPNCPLVRVPPHGRLIDADAVERNLIKMQMAQKGVIGHGIRKSRAVVRDMATVIPADEDGET